MRLMDIEDRTLNYRLKDNMHSSIGLCNYHLYIPVLFLFLTPIRESMLQLPN